MAPLIRAVLSKLIGDEEAAKIEIIANDVEVREDGSWEIKYRHPSSGFGHDKSQAILPYRALPNPPTTFFFGDGVSGQLRFTFMLDSPSKFIPRLTRQIYLLRGTLIYCSSNRKTARITTLRHSAGEKESLMCCSRTSIAH